MFSELKKPWLVAEIGANHDGKPEQAHELIEQMARAGADAVKFQLYTAEVLVADRERVVTWGPPGKQVSEPVGQMFDRLALPREAFGELFAHCREKGVEPFATVFDPGDVAFVAGLGQRIYKISSGDVNYRRLLEAIAGGGFSAIISGGKCTIGELDRAVSLLEQGGGISVSCTVSQLILPRSSRPISGFSIP